MVWGLMTADYPLTQNCLKKFPAGATQLHPPAGRSEATTDALERAAPIARPCQDGGTVCPLPAFAPDETNSCHRRPQARRDENLHRGARPPAPDRAAFARSTAHPPAPLYRWQAPARSPAT